MECVNRATGKRGPPPFHAVVAITAPMLDATWAKLKVFYAQLSIAPPAL